MNIPKSPAPEESIPMADALTLARLRANVRENAKRWTNVLKSHQLGSGMFNVNQASNDGACLFMGMMDEELDALGYTIASHSTAIIGQDKSGQLMLHTSVLVRAKGQKPRILT